MNPNKTLLGDALRYLLVMVCTIGLLTGDTLAYAPSTRSPQSSPPQDQAAKIPPDQLDSLVAPIALYPDPLLVQVLAASTYPLEIIQLQQWLSKNPGLKDQALADAVAKQPWVGLSSGGVSLFDGLPAAPLGEMNYVVEGAMIGGFALVAAPAEYGVTGLKTFMVSSDGVVYQKDFGPATLNKFSEMELINPDSSWTPVLGE